MTEDSELQEVPEPVSVLLHATGSGANIYPSHKGVDELQALVDAALEGDRILRLPTLSDEVHITILLAAPATVTIKPWDMFMAEQQAAAQQQQGTPPGPRRPEPRRIHVPGRPDHKF